MKKSKGFTLVELIIVIVIVGILSIIAVPMYRGYTMRAMGSEGKTLLGSVNSAQKVYYAEYGSFLSIPTAVGFHTLLDVDARSNKYFNTFSALNAGANGFTARTIGASNTGVVGKSIDLIVSVSSAAKWGGDFE